MVPTASLSMPGWSRVGFTRKNTPAKISPAARASSQSHRRRPRHSRPRAGRAVRARAIPQAARFPAGPERERSRSHLPKAGRASRGSAAAITAPDVRISSSAAWFSRFFMSSPSCFWVDLGQRTEISPEKNTYRSLAQRKGTANNYCFTIIPRPSYHKNYCLSIIFADGLRPPAPAAPNRPPAGIVRGRGGQWQVCFRKIPLAHRWRLWYNQLIKVKLQPRTNPQGVAAPWGFYLGLPSGVFAVKPLAYVVTDYTCRDSQQKVKYFSHAFHLLPIIGPELDGNQMIP